MLEWNSPTDGPIELHKTRMILDTLDRKEFRVMGRNCSDDITCRTCLDICTAEQNCIACHCKTNQLTGMHPECLVRELEMTYHQSGQLYCTVCRFQHHISYIELTSTQSNLMMYHCMFILCGLKWYSCGLNGQAREISSWKTILLMGGPQIFLSWAMFLVPVVHALLVWSDPLLVLAVKLFACLHGEMHFPTLAIIIMLTRLLCLYPRIDSFIVLYVTSSCMYFDVIYSLGLLFTKIVMRYIITYHCTVNFNGGLKLTVPHHSPLVSTYVDKLIYR